MSIFLLFAAVALIWLGIDALLLARHSVPPNQIERDEMMFGKAHRRPISPFLRSFAERRYPFATGLTMQIYGWLFIALGVLTGWLSWSSWHYVD